MVRVSLLPSDPVFLGASYKKSLDYRLREAPNHREQLILVLKDLQHRVSELQDFIVAAGTDQESSGSKSGSDDGSDAEAVGEDEDDNAFGQWALSDSDETDINTERTSKLNDEDYASTARTRWLTGSKREAAFSSLELAVECLYKLPVRQPPSLNRLRHLQAKTKADFDLYAHFDKLYVHDAFPNANRQVATRLGLLITQRRRILRYSELYNEELQKESDQSTITRQQRVTETSAGTTVQGPPPSSQIGRSERTTSILPKSSLEATTFRPGNDSLLNVMNVVSGADVDPDEVSSVATTSVGKDHLCIPDPPKDKEGHFLRTFQCPYCGIPTYLTSTHAWRKHLFRDLKPYVCTFENCSEPGVMYDSRDEWFLHESQHFNEFFCGVSSHEQYKDPAAFTDHMKIAHNILALERNDTAALQSFQRTSKRTVGVCSLCRETQGNLKHHLGRHLERIALFSIFMSEGSPDNEENGSKGSIASIGNVHGSREQRRSQAISEPVLVEDSSDENSRTSELSNQIEPPDASDVEDWRSLKPALGLRIIESTDSGVASRIMVTRPSMENRSPQEAQGNQVSSGSAPLSGANDNLAWQEVFDWLTQGRAEFDFAALQADREVRCHPDLADWFLAADNYRDWEGGKFRTLSCYGQAGLGKTMLMACVARRLKDQTGAEENKTAVLSCYISSQHSQEYDLYLAAMLGQLLQRQRQVSPTMQNLFMAKEPQNIRANADDLSTLLNLELADLDRVFILIDALDELEQQARMGLVKLLTALVNSNPQVQLFLTSGTRGSWPFDNDSRHWELNVPYHVLESFVASRIRQNPALRSLLSESLNDFSELVSILVGKAGGLILMAAVQLDWIESQEPQARDGLFDLANEVSSTLSSVYKGYLSQIEDQSAASRGYAHSIITWLAVARRELPIDLVKHAIALTNKSDIPLDQRTMLTTETILLSCRGLVVFSESTKTISFKHLTAFAFFTEDLISTFVDSPSLKTDVARILLHQLEDLKNNVLPEWRSDCTSIVHLYTKYPLLEYIFTDLSHIYASADDAFKSSLKGLFSTDTNGKRLATTLLSRINYQSLPKISEWFSASVLHVAAAFQIPELLQEAHAEGVSIDDLDGRGYSPLRWAVIAQARPMIRLLHRLGASFADYDNQGFTTLAWSMAPGHRTQSMNMQQGINVTEQASIIFGGIYTFNTSLAQAITFGNPIFSVYTKLEILVMLVMLSSLNLLLADAQVLMLLACSNRLRIVVDALVSVGVPILPASLSTAIQASSASHRISRLSVENTAEAIIGCVMQIDASLWRSDQLRVNTLSPNDEWMRSLVTKETMQHLDLRGRQPLSMAAEMGLFNVCAELISNGADVDHVDLDGWTPLMWAAVRPKWTKIYVDHCEVRDRAAVLLGIAVELKGHFSENEVYEDFNLSRMIENKIRIVCLLYDHGADMLRREPFLSYTAYDLASRDGLTTIADLLSSLNETMPEGLLEDTFSHRRDQVRTDTTTVYAEQSKLLTEAESEQDRQSWRLGLNWISCGTSTCRDDTVFICGGDSGPLEAMDRADVHQGEMEVQGTHIYLPNGVLQAIYSSIQLHVGNLDLSDEANVLYGRAVRQVEDFATDRASSFLRLRPQAETQSARDDYNRGVRSLFRQFEERKRRRDY